jgi:ABC-type glycerol-3-phosphate transport system permease component
MRAPRLGLTRRRLARSWYGDLLVFLALAFAAAFMGMPLLFAVMQAFKPFDELFLFPPRFFVRNPTLENFRTLLLLLGKSWVPISRYFFNSVFMVTLGMGGNIIITSLAAYPLAKHRFPGRNLYNALVVASLMFAPTVVAIPNYLTLARLGLINTPWAVIVPTWNYTFGLYLMVKFIDTMISDQLLAAARIDGAGEFTIYWRIVMPIIKPAWLTTGILVFQSLWRTTGGQFIYAENLKTLPYALNQIVSYGLASYGPAAVVALVMIVIPVGLFVWSQGSIVETMATSGMSTSGDE